MSLSLRHLNNASTVKNVPPKDKLNLTGYRPKRKQFERDKAQIEKERLLAAKEVAEAKTRQLHATKESAEAEGRMHAAKEYGA